MEAPDCVRCKGNSWRKRETKRVVTGETIDYYVCLLCNPVGEEHEGTLRWSYLKAEQELRLV